MSLLLRPLAWLIAGLCAAAGAGYWQARNNEATQTARFDSLARRAAEQVALRMRAYEYGLRGARGAVIAAGGVERITRRRFAEYSASRNIEREFQGARGFGLIRRVPADEEAAFVEARRIDGAPDFKVSRIGPNSGERYLVQYFEPAGGNDVALGLDIGSEPTRRTPADAAMQSGEATLTAPITLVLPDSMHMRGFLLLLPVLRTDAPVATLAERFRARMPAAMARAETVGWVYTALVIDEVLKGFDFQDGEFSLVLSDVTRPDLPERFYTSPGHAPALPSMLSTALPLQVFGRAWQVEVTAQPPFTKLLNLRNPWGVAAGVAALAVLFSMLSYAQALTRRRKLQADEQRSRSTAIEKAANARSLELDAIAADLAERRRAEEKTRASERFMRIVTDNIPGIVAYWTPDMRCTFANSSYTRWLGRTPQQMIGVTQLDLLGAEQFERNRPHIEAALAGHEQRVERTRTIADGSTVHYWLHYIPDRDDDGVVKGFISVAVDVTEMKQAQTQLEALNVALNERSAQAESANRAKSEFLANMSHEIRSPLNAVIGLTYLMRQTALDDGQRALLEKIEASSNALLGVINDILDISKIEAGQMLLDASEFDLPALLDHVVSMMAIDAGHKGIALHLDVEPGLPARLYGDVVRTRQILINLLSNAIKFTAQGSVRLILDQRGQVAERLWLRFTVVDTGIGIEADVLERLFTPFIQADMSTTRRFGGTGLGLSIVKQMTELMGGQYGVRSTPGVGSEFWVVLPLDAVPDAAASSLESRAPLGASPAGPRLVGIRVLVVDDSPINLQVCRHILEREGARVTTAQDGRVALETLRASPQGFDLVLMDVHMPNLDGNEAAHRIRHELGLTTLPVVALTASALVAERDRAFEAGMNDFVSKPFEPEALIRCVRRHAGRVPEPGDAAPADVDPPDLSDLPPSHWPRIDGIDSAQAFRRLGGDAGLLRSLLRRLLDEFGDLADQDGSSAVRQSGQVDLARRLHKLRGSAGLIGATALHAAAGEGEDALHTGSLAKAQGALLAAGAALRSLRDAAQALLDADPAIDAARADAAAAVLDADDLARLVEALRQQTMSALSMFDELAPGLSARLDDHRFHQVERAVRDLRFKEAADLLEHGEPG